MQGFRRQGILTARYLSQLLLGNIGGPGSSLMVARDLLDRIGGFKAGISYGEDWDFCLPRPHYRQIGFVPEALVCYRAHGIYMPEKQNQLRMQDTGVTDRA